MVYPPTLGPGISEDELMRLAARHDRVEVINGHVVITDFPSRSATPPMSPGYQHVLLATKVYDLLSRYVKPRQLGGVYPDGLLCHLGRTADQLIVSRIPDCCFITSERLPAPDWQHPFPGAPDLAVEIVSPTESAEEVQDKLTDYLRYGAQQVWIIYPASRSLVQHYADGAARRYLPGDTVDAAPLFPDLRFTLNTLFE